MAVGQEMIYFLFHSPLGATITGLFILPPHRVLRVARIDSNVMVLMLRTITTLCIKSG